MARCTFTDHPSLSLVVPVYNEEENLEPLVDAIFSALSKDAGFRELILVDDGSCDRTLALALTLAGREPRIHLLRHDQNRGLGAAIRTGLDAAEGELILYTDADLPFDFRVISRLVELAGEGNIVIGYRTNRGEGLRRWILSKSYNLLCRFALGLRVRDINFACKLFPQRTLRAMKLASEGSFIDAELLLEARRQGVHVTEFPLTYQPRVRGRSSLSRPRVILVILTEMARYLLGPNYVEYHKVLLAARSRVRRYGMAILGVAVVLLLNLLIQPIAGPVFFLTLLSTVVFAAWYGGLGPGLLAAVLAASSTEYLFLPPRYSLRIAAFHVLVGLALFALAALWVSVMAGLRTWSRLEAGKAVELKDQVDRGRE